MADNRKVAFNWYLNRQGPRGPQGVKGDTGFSPNITVETDTLNEYILRITNEGGYFLTSNLREHKEDRGGTYIRYDRNNGVMYAGEADTATDAKAGMIKIATAEDIEAEDESTAVTPAILADYIAGAGGASIDDTTVSSTKVWSSEKTSQSIAEVSNQVATNTTDISNIKTVLPNKQNKLTAGTNITIEGDVISATGSGSGDVTLAGDNSFTGNNTFDGVSTFNGDTWVNSLKVGTSLTNQQNKKFLAQGSITAGTNVSIEETTDGVKISATGGGSSEPPANMVTTDTDQTITGSKTFNGTVTLKSAEIGNQISALQVPLYTSNTTKTLTSIIQSYTDFDNPVSELRFGSIDNKLKIRGSQVVDKNNKKFLVQGSVTAGSDNLSITNTMDGVEIICDAPTNAQIDALQRLINDLSTKIRNLTNRVRDLETQIDGGIA